MADAQRSIDTLQAEIEFSGWQEQVDALYSQFVSELTESAGGNERRLSLAFDIDSFVVRLGKEVQTQAHWEHALAQFAARADIEATLFRLGQHLGRLEDTFTPDVIGALLHQDVTQTFSGTSTTSDWIRRRARAKLIGRVLENSTSPLRLHFEGTYRQSILERVFPQWCPYFHHEPLAMKPNTLYCESRAELSEFVGAARLNECFYVSAIIGELDCYTTMAAVYAQENDLVEILAYVEQRTAELLPPLMAEHFESFLAVVRGLSDSAGPERCQSLLRVGASRYCERLLDARYGDVDGCIIPATDWKKYPGHFDDLIRRYVPSIPNSIELFPPGHEEHEQGVRGLYLSSTLNGLLSGVMACRHLTALIGSLSNAELYEQVRVAFVGSALRKIEELPDDALCTPGGLVTLQLMQAIGVPECA